MQPFFAPSPFLARSPRGRRLRKLRHALLASAALLAGSLLAASSPDLARVPGVVIDYQPASGGRYIGSPGLAVLPDGRYVASHDFFGPKSTEHSRARTAVFRSDDRGATWRRIATVDGEFWSTLFVHDGALYLIGTDAHYGRAIIRRSTDGGETWTEPTDSHSGVLLPGKGYHCAPVPVVRHRGRLWRAMEACRGNRKWGTCFESFMLSVPVGADLLQATNWIVSTPLRGRTNWLDGRFRGWLEGNAVPAPDGQIVNLLRVHTDTWPEYAAMIHLSRDGRRATFDPATDFVTFPGGAKKFAIRWDNRSGLYWSLANYIPPAYRSQKPSSTRNTLALISSPDLRHWDVNCVLLHHPETKKHGFQYVEWLFDGDDLIAASRTAYDDDQGGAHNYHDANYLTFHRIKNFRRLTLADSPPALREAVMNDPATRSPAPRVLLLGDSISIGYHPYVRRALEREMVVVRPIRAPGQAENCAGTTYGVANLDRWLTSYGGRWDVIHFNWGLHDLKHVDPQTGRSSVSPDDPPQADLATYQRQLRQIVARLRQTGARLIFATTTPVPDAPVKPWRRNADVIRYNAAALEIMRENGIAVDDLYALARPHLAEWQRPANVHFTPAGSAALAQQVVQSIRRALAEKTGKKQ
jgi:lysophospholipase L1-like esterase